MITTFTYDAAGNRTRLNVDGALTTYAYDAGNRLRRSQEVAGITTFTFDNNGNQRRVESPTNELTTYSWSYENQLKVVENPDGELTTYTWAPSNRRGVELRVAKETETVLTNYLWDDQRLLMETDEVGAVEAEYTLQPKAYGPLVSQRRDSESSFYSFDALGSTAALTDDTQAVTDQYAYKPFGEVRSSSGTTQNPYLWRGRDDLYRDTDSGFYSLGRAQYAADIGRMITPVGDGGETNQYAQGPSAVTEEDRRMMQDLWDSFTDQERENLERIFRGEYEGRMRLPSPARGQWIQGEPGDGVFKYDDTPYNRRRGVAGMELPYTDGYIPPGGFPAESYYNGSADAATAVIPRLIDGDEADFRAADEYMKRIYDDPQWERPEGYTWHYVGPPGSRTLELIETPTHRAVPHRGAAAGVRAFGRIMKRARVRVFGVTARACGVVDCYMTLRDLLWHDPAVLEGEVTFTDNEDGESQFIVYPEGSEHIDAAHRKYISGPKKGIIEFLSEGEVDAYRFLARVHWGWFEPGLFEGTWHPGIYRKTLPVFGFFGQTIGYYDKDGWHPIEEGYNHMDPCVRWELFGA